MSRRGRVPQLGLYFEGYEVVLRAGVPAVCIGKGHPIADARGYASVHRLLGYRKNHNRLSRFDIVRIRDGNLMNWHPDNIIVEAAGSQLPKARKSAKRRSSR